MGHDPRTSVIGIGVLVLCTAFVTAGVARAPAPRPARTATPEERAEMALVVARSERDWRSDSAQHFPSDHWSQRDDFHGRESKKVEELAKEKGVRIEDVLRAVDEDLHRRAARTPDDPDARSASAVPCKPRPFYD